MVWIKRGEIMKSKVIIGIMFTLLLIGILTLAFNIQPVKSEPTSIIVPDDYEKIQWAIGNATEGDTILVKAGTYNEHVFVDKTLTLIGENKSNTIISGLDLGHGPSWGLVSITASNAVVTGFAIRDFTTSTQIGVFMRNSYHCNISGNIIANHSYGIDIRQSEDNFIGNNTLSRCSVYGIVISESSKNNILRNNNWTGNNWNLGVFSYFFHDIDTSNLVDGKPVYYWVNQKDKEVPNDAGYVALVNSTNIVVKNLTIAHNQGVLLAHTTNSTIEDVNVSTSLRGFYLIHSHNNTICRCDTTQTAEGIRLEGSNNNQISENIISHYYDIGIMFEDSERNTITNNTMSVDWMNSKSFWISGGNNIIYHNNILHHYKRFFSDGSPNTWDNGYPSGGNYWSDYNGTDLYSGASQNETGSDGIGDIPYEINMGNVDRYPLMGHISFFNAGTWDGIIYYVHTISNSTISDFYFSEDNKLVSLNVTRPDGTFGFCRVTIPNEILWCDNQEQWQVWVNNTLIEDIKIIENTNHTYIHFTYNHSTQNIKVIGVHVIPEFPSFLILPLFMTTTLLAVIIYRRKHSM
jgi:parallel beta-helix repeat protein